MPAMGTSSLDEPCRQCKQIDAMVSGEFARSPMGSLTVGVVSGDKLVWTKSYGNAESKLSLTANQDTVYRIGSITKMFTATMLDSFGALKLELTDPVEKYFADVNRGQKRYKDAPPITLLQLATHTSGLSREPDHTFNYVTGDRSPGKKPDRALPHVITV